MFKVGDRVWDIMRQEWGIVERLDDSSYPVNVRFDGDEFLSVYMPDGRISRNYRTPSLTFKEFYLPDGWQERPRWRAEIDNMYWSVTGYGECVPLCDKRYGIDDTKFKLGNYFQTEEEAMGSKFYKVFHEEV